MGAVGVPMLGSLGNMEDETGGRLHSKEGPGSKVNRACESWL